MAAATLIVTAATALIVTELIVTAATPIVTAGTPIVTLAPLLVTVASLIVTVGLTIIDAFLGTFAVALGIPRDNIESVPRFVFDLPSLPASLGELRFVARRPGIIRRITRSNGRFRAAKYTDNDIKRRAGQYLLPQQLILFLSPRFAGRPMRLLLHPQPELD